MADVQEQDRRNAPADDAVAALNLGKLRRAKEALDSANGSYRNVVKHVEGKGIHLKAAKRALSVIKADNRDEVMEEEVRFFEYLAILGNPVAKKQLDLFRVENPRTPGVDKAAEQGRYAGIMGEGMEANPYGPVGELGQTWIAAWHRGGDERQLILAMEPAEGSELIKGSGDDDSGGEDDADPFAASNEEWDGAAPTTEVAE